VTQNPYGSNKAPDKFGNSINNTPKYLPPIIHKQGKQKVDVENHP
jgi:hypothetical protein